MLMLASYFHTITSFQVVALCIGTFCSDYCSPKNHCCANLKTCISFVMYVMFLTPFDDFDFISEILKSLILKAS
jgi:hypothetical protein